MMINNWRNFASLWTLLAIAASTCVAQAPPVQTENKVQEDRLLFDFESGSYDGWQVEGKAFAQGPIEGTRYDISGYRGQYLVNSFNEGDPSTGTLLSPGFEITHDHLTFLVSGGDHPSQTGVELIVAGEVVASASGNNSGEMEWRSLNVRQWRDQQAQLRVIDRATGGWGHINLDHVVLSDQPRSGSGAWRLEEYRRSTEYYRELHRPQFHFTPELNWMNDPNGLVYANGEYHLFYQHNPHGNSWGHMSWGHAVSKDLIRWRHLPIAIHEEYGVMAFSGSAVVDEKNTSGFGIEHQLTGQTTSPLVAIFTGHGRGKQTQDLAYSNDGGLTFVKYHGNPVLDISNRDFRDPKVFWYEPTKRWVMLVSLAVEKRLQFYESTNLIDWIHLSDFGPAGFEGKSNWECPDIFPLASPVENGGLKWVLEVDMGSGAIAGGSGGEYFIGDFDGKVFRPDREESQWVDYGRDFYAPVSWNNIPEADGRRIWIGWMNNWETAMNPTYPWRSAMSIPRQLSLVPTERGLQLAQQPIAELQSLRREEVGLSQRILEGETSALPLEGQQLEIHLTLRPLQASRCGIRVLKSGETYTEIGYEGQQQKLYVDRRQSGNVDYHPTFAGIHAGPLAMEDDGTVQFRIIVDACSVEVFGGDGETVITDLVFPDTDCRQVTLFAEGSACEVIEGRVWKLNEAIENPVHQRTSQIRHFK